MTAGIRAYAVVRSVSDVSVDPSELVDALELRGIDVSALERGMGSTVSAAAPSSATEPTGQELRDLRSALFAIPAEDRGIWIRMAMALKSALGNAGWPLFDAWSGTTTAGNFDPAENRAQWDSVAPAGEDRGKVGIGSLFALAREHGWPRASLGDLELRPDAAPPTDVIAELCALDAGFDRAWQRRGPREWTQSTYDLSIATRLVAVGTEDQEILDALVAHRRGGREAAPENARGYYAATLAVARERTSEGVRRPEGDVFGVPAARAASPPEPAAPTLRPSAGVPNGRAAGSGGSDERDGARALIRCQIGLDVARVLRYGSADERGRFVLELADRRTVVVGPIESLLGQRQFGHRLAEVLRRWPPAIKAAAWRPVGRALLVLVEQVPIGPQGELGELVADWVDGWIRGRTLPSREDAAPGLPHVHDGATWLRLEDLGQYLYAERRERISARELAQSLRATGWEPTKAKVCGRATNLWRRPGVFGADGGGDGVE